MKKDINNMKQTLDNETVVSEKIRKFIQKKKAIVEKQAD